MCLPPLWPPNEGVQEPYLEGGQRTKDHFGAPFEVKHSLCCLNCRGKSKPCMGTITHPMEEPKRAWKEGSSFLLLCLRGPEWTLGLWSCEFS